MFALRQQQRRGRVAKSMKVTRGQSSSLEKRPVHIREKVARLHGPSDRVGKHQPEVLPQIAGRTALLILAYLMAPKREVEAWGVEGTGCYGVALARFLAGQGQQVLTRMGPQDQPGNRRWSGSKWWTRARTMQAGGPPGAGCVCSPRWAAPSWWRR
jgi:hypothetical protein